MEARIGFLSSQNSELERNNDILSKENHQFMKSIETYEIEMDKIIREKEKIKLELDQTLQALNEMWFNCSLMEQFFSFEIQNCLSTWHCFISAFVGDCSTCNRANYIKTLSIII